MVGLAQNVLVQHRRMDRFGDQGLHAAAVTRGFQRHLQVILRHAGLFNQQRHVRGLAEHLDQLDLDALMLQVHHDHVEIVQRAVHLAGLRPRDPESRLRQRAFQRHVVRLGQGDRFVGQQQRLIILAAPALQVRRADQDAGP